MLDGISAFTRGGVVVWSYYFSKIPSPNPIDFLIKNVLLEERIGSSMVLIASYTLQWRLLNDIELIIVALQRSNVHMHFVQNLLNQIQISLRNVLKNKDVLDLVVDGLDFDKEFLKIFEVCHQHHLTSRNNKTAVMTSYPNLHTNQNTDQIHQQHYNHRQKKSQNTLEDDEENGNEKKKKNKRKEMRQWDLNSKITKKKIDELDYSNKDYNISDALTNDKTTYGADMQLEDSDSENESSLDDNTINENETTPSWFGRFASNIQAYTGNKIITEDDMDRILPEFKDHLSSKNVAEDVIDLLLKSIKNNLIGTKTPSFTTLHSAVKKSIKDAIIKILTPKKSVDVLRNALEAKSEKRVYSIVFLGINGVGKSTNLAKVAYYLKNKANLSVMIAACDTFRAGAVEQLRTHSRCLDIPLFEKGYGKDAAFIARDALSFARQKEYDVVLIDTAGRMQDNLPLLRSLAKLVSLNNPDLILFVGEALTGNDSIDQLNKFNQALIEFCTPFENEKSPSLLSSSPSYSRSIDGILLTKFDTVDDKVGAALSMVYSTGQPIVFVGTGQKYPNLKKLHPDTVVNALLG